MTNPVGSDNPSVSTRVLIDCRVISNTCLAKDIYLMRLQSPEVAKNAQPGQFVNLRTDAANGLIWRRPLSICRRNAAAGWFEVLWKIVGSGTSALSQRHPGDLVSVIGPLGHGFTFGSETELAILVAGGIGIAALPFLCEELVAVGIRAEVFLGARNSAELVLVDDFTHLAASVTLATEDGITGEKGFVTAPLQVRLAGIAQRAGTKLFSCGPPAFLQAMSAISEKTGIAGEIAVETPMACGFGICVGCAVRVRQPASGENVYKLACLDGPVFEAGEVEIDAGS